MKTRKIVFLAIMLAISIVLSIVESMIPLGIPGVKIGLANVITLIILYTYGKKEAFLLVILRVCLVGMLRSTLPTFMMSLSGGLLAFMAMLMLKELKKFSIVSVSILGSIGHSVGQIIMAILILNTEGIIFYLPVILLISVPTGILTGIISDRFLKVFKGEMR